MQLSPLKYPGGKTRAVKILKEYIPEGATKVVSPFFGGGSFENFLSLNGHEVHGYDFSSHLVDFWKSYMGDKTELFRRSRELFQSILIPKYVGVDPKSPERQEQKDIFWGWREIVLNSDEQFERGVHYFALNRCVFSGLTLCSGMKSTKWLVKEVGEQAIGNLEKIPFHVKSVNHMSCFESIEKHNKDFLYLDPPYIMEEESKEAIYGNKGDMHKGFDHTLLRDILSNHKGKWVLSYLNVPETHELYSNFNIQEVSWTYSMRTGKDSRPQGRELVITNF